MLEITTEKRRIPSVKSNKNTLWIVMTKQRGKQSTISTVRETDCKWFYCTVSNVPWADMTTKFNDTSLDAETWVFEELTFTKLPSGCKDWNTTEVPADNETLAPLVVSVLSLNVSEKVNVDAESMTDALRDIERAIKEIAPIVEDIWPYTSSYSINATNLVAQQKLRHDCVTIKRFIIHSLDGLEKYDQKWLDLLSSESPRRAESISGIFDMLF